MTYDVQYFIDKFEAIPEEKWCTGVSGGKGVTCAFGHCAYDVATGTIQSDWIDRQGALIKALSPLGQLVQRINDGKDLRYQQPTPKQRILAALRDVQAKAVQA